jgi:hypothetical protein
MPTKVRVVQVQWWEREPVHLVAVEGSQDVEELDPAAFKQFQQRVGMMQQADNAALQDYNARLQTHIASPVDDFGASLEPHPGPAPTPTAPKYNDARVLKRCYYEAFLGTALLGKRKMTVQQFTFKAMTGDWDRKENCFYGMVRDMTDPQRWANKWLSQTMHILNTNAKGGLMAETDAFVNQKKAELDWADPTKIVWVKPGALDKNKVKERQPANMPQGLAELMQFAISSLRDVTGINLELLGQADREQAAALEMQRRQSAMTTLATMFDSLRRYRKEQGRLMLEFIELLPPGTLYSVLKDGQYQYIPLMKSNDEQEYDVIIDQTPTSPDQKKLVWSVTEKILSMGLELPMPVIVTLLKYSPYPQSVVLEITKALGMGGEQSPEQTKEKLAQAEQALQVLEQALEKMSNELEQEKSDNSIEEYRAMTERLKVRLDAIISGQKEEAQPQYPPEQV